jgi:hypothetical protein
MMHLNRELKVLGKLLRKINPRVEVQLASQESPRDLLPILLDSSDHDEVLTTKWLLN